MMENITKVLLSKVKQDNYSDSISCKGNSDTRDRGQKYNKASVGLLTFIKNVLLDDSTV